MESLFIQLSDDVLISISKKLHLWLVLWSMVTYWDLNIYIHAFGWVLELSNENRSLNWYGFKTMQIIHFHDVKQTAMSCVHDCDRHNNGKNQTDILFWWSIQGMSCKGSTLVWKGGGEQQQLICI